LAEGAERGAAVVAFCDADGEYDPAELERLATPILAGRADYVVGSRFAGGPRRMRPYRWLGNRVLSLALSVLAGRRITDGQSGYRALSGEAAAAAEIIHDYNYAQVLTLDLLAKGFRYAEVPISYRFRTKGRSFVRLVPYLRRVVPAVARQMRAPPPPATPPPPNLRWEVPEIGKEPPQVDWGRVRLSGAEAEHRSGWGTGSGPWRRRPR
jgi:glycosyltransferase involved in cell wall biosynthesis